MFRRCGGLSQQLTNSGIRIVRWHLYFRLVRRLTLALGHLVPYQRHGKRRCWSRDVLQLHFKSSLSDSIISNKRHN